MATISNLLKEIASLLRGTRTICAKSVWEGVVKLRNKTLEMMIYSVNN